MVVALPRSEVVTAGLTENFLRGEIDNVIAHVLFHLGVIGAPFVHLFATKRQTLEKELKRLRKLVADIGVVWVSWPKKSSGVTTDITEDVIREVCLPLGFVDVKVCAVDETWSGLKLMIRRENRAGRRSKS